MAISFIDVYKVMGKSDKAMDMLVSEVEILAKNVLTSNQNINDFIEINITKIEHFREVMLAYLIENGVGYEEMANITQSAWQEQAKHFQATQTHIRFFAVVSYLFQTNQRIAVNVQKKINKWIAVNPNTQPDIMQTFPQEKALFFEEYIALLPKIELLSWVAIPTWVEEFEPSVARMEDIIMCIEQNMKKMVELAQNLGWLPKPKPKVYESITEEELNDKTLKGWAKTKRDTEVINAYIREGKDIKQLEEVLNVTFG